LIGYWLARKSVRPIAEVNRQLQDIRAPDLSRRIDSPELDAEFRDLVRHINELLARLEKSFNDMGEYSAKVAHELRTPLAILRLKVEQAGNRIAHELAEELQAELHQLTHVVDQSLLMAKAGQGRLVLHPRDFDLTELLADVAEDFALLAQEEDRRVNVSARSPCIVLADPKYARQMIHNLISNALKHGQGEIRLKLSTVHAAHRLTIANRVRAGRSGPPDALGLGLRVVDTLLSLQPELKCRRRHSRGCFVVQLELPAVGRPELQGRRPATVEAAIDPGI
jgi:signal transduction histidine kinase